MTQKNNFTFPRIENVELIKQCYADINGSQSFLPVKNWQTDVWTAEVQCSSGPVLKKAGLAVVEMTGGTVEGASADMTLLQTLAWPVNPCIPGLIIMASTGKIEDQDVMVTVYIDLIIQNGAPNQNDKDMLTWQPLRRSATGMDRAWMNTSLFWPAAACWAVALLSAAYSIFLRKAMRLCLRR